VVSIDLAAFDIAGTTVEEHGLVYEALADAVRAGGADPSREQVETWMGADKRTAITALLEGHGDVEETFRDFRRLLGEHYAARPPKAMPGAVETFAALRESGAKIALTTGFDREVTDLVLGTVGWDDDVLDAVVCTEDVPLGRPAPYLVFRAMEWTGVTDVRRVLVAGDTERDVEAALNAGVGTVVGVRSGGVDDATLRLDPRVVVVDSVRDLAALVDVPA
jgi:phosphonatase-like hydrolase